MSSKRTIECLGVPGSGKSTAAVALAEQHGLAVVPQRPARGMFIRCIVRYPLFAFCWAGAMLFESVRTGTYALIRFKFAVFCNTCARVMHARLNGGVLDEGFAQRLLSLYEHRVDEATFRRWVAIMPLMDTVAALTRTQSKVAPARQSLGESHVLEWRAVIAHNQRELLSALVQSGKDVRYL